MSVASARKLRVMWEDSTETSVVRWQAFHLWKLGALRHAETLEILRAIPEDSPFFEEAIHSRALVGDKSAEAAFAKMLSRTSFGAIAGSRIWGPVISAALDVQLAQLGNHPNGGYLLAELLTFAPATDARGLLIRNWAQLRLIPRFVSAALAVGGSELEALAAETIANWPIGESDPLEFAVLDLEMGYGDGLVAPVDKDRIARLLPYANRFDEFDLQRLGELARKYGFPLWGRERIAPLLGEPARAAVFPTESDLKRQLDELLLDEGSRQVRAMRLAEVAEEQSDGLYDPLMVLDEWLSGNTSDAALEIAAQMIVAFSRRLGGDILVRHSDMSQEVHRRRVADVDVQLRRASL